FTIPDPQVEWIGVGHSLGFMKLLQSHVQWKGLVSIAGFTQFKQREAALQMLNNREVTLASLESFYQKSGHHPYLSPANIPRLRMDLDLLLELDLTRSLQEKQIPVLALAGKDDPIVPLQLSQNCFGASLDVDLHFIETSRHALGYLEADRCFSVIYQWMHERFE
ncbi:MAG: hypothetical protein WD595_00210, partial [Waddliaceae bacterium]